MLTSQYHTLLNYRAAPPTDDILENITLIFYDLFWFLKSSQNLQRRTKKKKINSEANTRNKKKKILTTEAILLQAYNIFYRSWLNGIALPIRLRNRDEYVQQQQQQQQKTWRSSNSSRVCSNNSFNGNGVGLAGINSNKRTVNLWGRFG